MSCWVVPTIAAELWGVSLAQIFARVADGSVPSQREHGFLFVDVSDRSQPHQTTRKSDGPPPPTFVPVTRDDDGDDAFDAIIAEELGLPTDAPAAEDAPSVAEPWDPFLADDAAPPADGAWAGAWGADDDLPPLDEVDVADVLPPDPVVTLPQPVAAPVEVEEDPELPPLCEEEDARPLGNWRQRRQSVARTRRPPPLAA